MYYSNEVRSFDEVEVAVKLPISDPERNMACKLVEALSSGEFDPAKYSDTYSERVKQAIQDKMSGSTVKSTPTQTPKKGSVIDITALLEQSLAEGRKPKEPGKK
jgi:DNA end-binding protein Ku